MVYLRLCSFVIFCSVTVVFEIPTTAVHSICLNFFCNVNMSFSSFMCLIFYFNYFETKTRTPISCFFTSLTMFLSKIEASNKSFYHRLISLKDRFNTDIGKNGWNRHCLSLTVTDWKRLTDWMWLRFKLISYMFSNPNPWIISLSNTVCMFEWCEWYYFLRH